MREDRQGREHQSVQNNMQDPVQEHAQGPVLVYAGTTEGRRVCLFLTGHGVRTIACVATEYGGDLLEEEGGGFLTVCRGRLTEDEMEELAVRENPSVIIDATHPYAEIVSGNIDQSCRRTGKICLRIERKSGEGSGEHREGGVKTSCKKESEKAGRATEEKSRTGGRVRAVAVDSVAEAAVYLAGQEGKILVTTGTKELKEYTRIPGYRERVYARILSVESSVAEAVKLGFEGKNLICMQGPFSLEMNRALIHMTGASFLVTKESGAVGGYPEKEQAARELGITLVVVKRPQEIRQTGSDQVGSFEERNRADGYCRLVLSEEKAYGWLREQFLLTEDAGEDLGIGLEGNSRWVTLVGIGMGSLVGMTGEVVDAIREADLLIGARRMMEAGLVVCRKPAFVEYRPEVIRAYLQQHPELGRVTILLSGDSGFYSGARKLEEALKDRYRVRVLPGISSVSYLAAKAHTSWEDARILSIHGRETSVLGTIRRNRKVFLLTSGGDSLTGLWDKLRGFGMGHLRITIGANLSEPEETLIRLSPAEPIPNLRKLGSLVTLLIQNDQPDKLVSAGLPDGTFLRGGGAARPVPMTKSEVRAVALSKLELERDSVVWDIGAGTGSVSAECARLCSEGQVVAVEQREDAADLIKKNAARFGADNLTLIRGRAPEALTDDLPAPTHVFLGGTTGGMEETLKEALRRKGSVHVVITAVTLETLQEALHCLKTLPFSALETVCLTVARSRQVGSYSMMQGGNPVWILSAQGCPDRPAISQVCPPRSAS